MYQRQRRRPVCVITLPARADKSRPIISFRRCPVVAAVQPRQSNSIDRLARRLLSVLFTHHRLRSAIEIDRVDTADRRVRRTLAGVNRRQYIGLVSRRCWTVGSEDVKEVGRSVRCLEREFDGGQ